MKTIAACIVGACALSLISCSGDPWSSGEEPGLGQAELSQQVLSPIGQFTFSVKLIPGSSPAEYPIVGSGAVDLDPGAQIRSQTFLPFVLNTGTESTLVQLGAKTGGITTEGPVTVLSGAQVNGDIQSAAQVLVFPGATVSGGVLANQPHGTYENLTFSADFSGTRQGPAFVAIGQTKVISPGRYPSLFVSPAGTASLASGVYYTDSLTVAPGGTLALSDPAGFVVIYVRDAFGWAGAVTGTDAEGRLLIADAGSLPVSLISAFRGTIVAPNAALSAGGLVGTTHRGAFIARDVDLELGVILEHAAFHRNDWLPPRLADWREAPVILRASKGDDGTTHDAEQTATTAVPFTIPDSIRVTQGNAANGTAKLTFVDPAGHTVTCTYRGGSTSPHPRPDTSLVDWAKGFKYYFVSCDNGADALSSASGTTFKLHVISGDGLGTRVVVEQQFGEGCSGTLEDPIDPVTSAQIAESFSWAQTSPLPVTDPSGHPSLYYAWIYLTSPQQAAALDKLGLHWSPQPLFAEQYRGYAGKCGSFEYQGDGLGLFVYAIIPGSLYNLIRSAGMHPTSPTDPIPFVAVHLPNKPDVGDPAIWNADGSLSWNELKALGFQYIRGRVEFNFDKVTQPCSFFTCIGNWVEGAVSSAVNFIVENGTKLVDEVWTKTTEFFGIVDKFLGGSVTVHAHFIVENRDPMFSNTEPMRRGWGPKAGQAIVPHGSTIYAKQWLWGFIPETYESDLGEDGRVSIKVGKKNTTRGASGLCLNLDNHYGAVASLGIAMEECDFRNLDFQGFRQDSNNDVRTGDYKILAMTQVTDGGHYLQDVVGHEPHHAEIGVGLPANAITAVNDSSPFTPCLNFKSLQADLITVLTVGLGTLGGPIGVAIGAFAAHALEKDIFLSNTDASNAVASRQSRGVMTHEYGHFAMCSMMSDRQSSSLFWLVGRLGEGQADSRNDTLSLNFESFADFVASQIVGGTNYLSPPGGGFGFTAKKDNLMSYCSAPNCMDQNFRGINDADPTDEFNDQEASKVTMFADAFDGQGRFRSTQPNNSDLWQLDSNNLLRNSTAEYLPGNGVNDENVALDGRAVKDWINRWVDTGSLSRVAKPFVPALFHVMEDRGVSWCDRCDVFALHSPDPRVQNATTMSAVDRRTRQDFCALQAVDPVGAPPQADLKIDAVSCDICPDPARQIVVDGHCDFCPAGQVPVGNTCSSCPPGEVTQNGTCVPCAPIGIIVNNGCIPCGASGFSDATATSCHQCPADAVVDWATFANTCSRVVESFDSDAQDPNDPCPNQFWVEVTNLPTLASGSAGWRGLSVSAAPVPMPATQDTCLNTWSQLSVLSPDPGALSGWSPIRNQSLRAGSWCEPAPDRLCIAGAGCSYSDGATVSREDALNGPDKLRFGLFRGSSGKIVGHELLTVHDEGATCLGPR